MSVVSIPRPGIARRDPSPRRPPASAAPRLRVVRPARRALSLRLGVRRVAIMAGIVALLSSPFALVLVHLDLTANQLRLSQLQSRADTAQSTYEKLRLQVAQLESPDRIVATAQQLGMVTPTTIRYLTASPGSGAIADPTPSAPGVAGWASAKRVDTGR